jgi:hypothetical protein
VPSRRGFLGLLAGVALDPDRLLWVPGKKLVSLAAPADPPLPMMRRDAFLEASRPIVSYVLHWQGVWNCQLNGESECISYEVKMVEVCRR